MVLSDDIAALTGFACECVLWGGYCILFLFSLGLLYRRTRCGHLNSTSLIMHCLLFTTCTAHFALEFNHFYTTLGATGVPGFANETKPLAASDIFISISDLLGDAMLIYRCWFPWGDHRWVVLPLALPAIAGFACMLQSIHFVLSVSPTSPVPPAAVVPLTTAGFALPLRTNVMATALIVLRIWQLTGQSAWSSSLNSSRRRADVSSRATAMFVESGLLYLAAQLVFVVLIAIKHPAQAVLAVIAVQIYGITPTLIVIRGAAGYPTGTVVGIASEMVWTPTLKETFNDPPTAFDSADEKQPKSTAGDEGPEGEDTMEIPVWQV